MDQSKWLGLLVGMVIGAGYAWLQLLALRRNELLQQQEKPRGVIAMLPGSMARVALLLLVLVLIQVLDQKQMINRIWLVIGLVVAYSVPFFWRLKQMMSRKR
jgi:hypothetical protein